MPKQKTHKGLKARCKVSGTGKIKRKKANGGHLMSHKDSAKRRSLSKQCGFSKAFTKKALIALNA